MPKIPPIITKISQNIATGCEKAVNKAGEHVGKLLENPAKTDKFIKLSNKTEFTGMNYSFAGMSAIMIAIVLVKRLMTVFTRPTTDARAKWDEFKEILFRDAQTIAIMLLLLNGTCTALVNKSSKKTGLPLTNKAFEKVFDTTEEGLKGIGAKIGEIIHQPGKKLGTMARNFGNAFNPIGGINSLNNDEITSKYSGMDTIDKVKKMFIGIKEDGGDENKVLKTLLTNIKKETEITKKAEEKIALLEQRKSGIKGLNRTIDKINNLISSQNPVEELFGEEALKNKELNVVREIIKNELTQQDNILVHHGKGMNAKMRTGALLMEATYLGAGLPLLYNKILRRKYLKPGVKPVTIQNPADNISSLLISKQISFTENKLYKKFVK